MWTETSLIVSTRCPLAAKWGCAINRGEPEQRRRINVRAQAIDWFGNASGFTDAVTLLIDRNAPQVDLDQPTTDALQDGWIGPNELELGGTLQDDFEARTLTLCEGTVYSPDCPTQTVNPGDQPTGAWLYDFNNVLAGDGVTTTISLYGINGAGNRSAAHAETFRIDFPSHRLSR